MPDRREKITLSWRQIFGFGLFLIALTTFLVTFFVDNPSRNCNALYEKIDIKTILNKEAIRENHSRILVLENRSQHIEQCINSIEKKIDRILEISLSRYSLNSKEGGSK